MSSSSVRNVAKDHAQVGVQAGVIHGGVRIAPEPATAVTFAGQLDAFRSSLWEARAGGRVDAPTYAAVEAELALITESLAADTPSDRSTMMVALKRLGGLISDVTDLATKAVALVAAARGMS